MFRHILISLFVITLISPITINAKEGQEIFSRVVINNGEHIIAGDSTVFSVIIYSNLPFGEIKCTDSNVKISGCRVRQTYQGNGRRQSRSYLGGRAYYSTVWSQYVIGSNNKGKYTFPSLSFSAQLYIEQSDDIDPFDPFGFFRQPRYKKVKATLKSPETKFEIIDQPRKSTEELMNSGKTVI